MPDGLYEHDILAWSERQSELMRRLAAGERVNEAVDWSNVIEELHDVGLSELKTCRSLLRQALIHLLKLYSWPESAAVRHWRGELLNFLADARDRFTPSMRQRIDLDSLYEQAREQCAQSGEGGRAARDRCPYGLDDLLTFKPDIDALVASLSEV